MTHLQVDPPSYLKTPPLDGTLPKTPLSEIEDHENHVVNPLEDLVPVCPNCHAMLHRPKGQTLTVEELRQRMDETAGRLSAG
ncbi:MAG: hypothetical protein F4X37_02710 [Acidimicrobiia bacterium]|nr:hypothetical protein [Acidimicrobiia bacterium]